MTKLPTHAEAGISSRGRILFAGKMLLAFALLPFGLVINYIIRAYCCPGDPIFEEMTGSGGALIFFGAALPLISVIIFVLVTDLKFDFVDKTPRRSMFARGLVPTSDTNKKLAILGNVVVLSFIVGGSIVVYGAAFYYYATPNDIIVYHGPFQKKSEYKWNDVEQISEGCAAARRGGRYFWLDLEFTDGQSIDVVSAKNVFRTLRFAQENKATGHDLSGAHYIYHTNDPSECPTGFYYPDEPLEGKR